MKRSPEQCLAHGCQRQTFPKYCPDEGHPSAEEDVFLSTAFPQGISAWMPNSPQAVARDNLAVAARDSKTCNRGIRTETCAPSLSWLRQGHNNSFPHLCSSLFIGCQGEPSDSSPESENTDRIGVFVLVEPECLQEATGESRKSSSIKLG